MEAVLHRFVRSVLIRRGESITLPARATISPGGGRSQVTILIAERTMDGHIDVKEKRILFGKVYEVYDSAVVWMPQKFRRASLQVAIPVGKRIQYGPEPKLT